MAGVERRGGKVWPQCTGTVDCDGGALSCRNVQDAMIWPRDASLQKFMSRTASAVPAPEMGSASAGQRRFGCRAALAACMAVCIVLPLGGTPASADDTRGGEKLIGTFQIRAGQERAGAGGEPIRQPAPNARRNFLTGESAVPQSIDDIFRREAGDRVFFGSGSAEIGTRARTVIVLQAEWLKRNPQIRLTIEGHADDGGTAEQNIKIALERAEALRERLIGEGVEARRIAVVSRGREDRLAVCADSACMAQNRRAIVVVHAIGSGERIGLDRARAQDAPPLRPGEADGSRRAPVPR